MTNWTNLAASISRYPSHDCSISVQLRYGISARISHSGRPSTPTGTTIAPGPSPPDRGSRAPSLSPFAPSSFPTPHRLRFSALPYTASCLTAYVQTLRTYGCNLYMHDNIVALPPATLAYRGRVRHPTPCALLAHHRTRYGGFWGGLGTVLMVLLKLYLS